MVTLENLVKKTGVLTLLSLSGCAYNPYMDTDPVEHVVLYPGSPTAEEDLHCRVDESFEESFDFYWLVNREQAYTESGAASLLEKGLYRVGDFVECSAWTSASSSSDGYEIGTSGVYIQ